jgi:gamma-glutamyl:cysteine ligase YbdK (ATP-grasp superfamily)
LNQQLAELAPLARELGLDTVLAPLEGILRHGNQAMRWLHRHSKGEAIATIVASDAAALVAREEALG